MEPASVILTTAFHHVVDEPNLEAGFERFLTLSGAPLTYAEFCDAVAGLVTAGLVREPVRLPEGALQCHWRLELTPAGVAEARRRETARSH